MFVLSRITRFSSSSSSFFLSPKRKRFLSNLSETKSEKLLQVHGKDGRLVLLKEIYDYSGIGIDKNNNDVKKNVNFNVSVGDVLYDENGKVPWGVVLFEAHGGLFYAGSIKNDIILGDKSNEFVKTREGEKFQISNAVGNSIDSFGLCLDGIEKINVNKENYYDVFRYQPRDVERQIITQGLRTGITVVDTMMQIGQGQSMLFGSKYDQAFRRDEFLLDATLNSLKNPENPSDLHSWFSVPPNPSSEIFNSLEEKLKQSNIREKCTIINFSNEILRNNNDDNDVLGLFNNYIACTLSEVYRDNGSNALLILPDLHSMYLVWRRAARLSSSYYNRTSGKIPANIYAPGSDRSDLRQFYSALIQRSAKLNDDLGAGSLTTFHGVFFGNNNEYIANENAINENKIYNLNDFDMADRNYNRLKALDEKGIKLSLANLNKLAIRPPQPKKQDNYGSIHDSKNKKENYENWGLTGPIISGESQTQHGEELKSISDGHITIKDSYAMFDVDLADSLTRIGVGCHNEKKSRDTRALALAQVTGGLRINICNYKDQMYKDDHSFQIIDLFSKSLRHKIGSNVKLEHQVTLVHALSKKLFGGDDRKYLEDGYDSIFMKYLRNEKFPDNLYQQISLENKRLSDNDLYQLEQFINGIMKKIKE